MIASIGDFLENVLESSHVTCHWHGQTVTAHEACSSDFLLPLFIERANSYGLQLIGVAPFSEMAFVVDNEAMLGVRVDLLNPMVNATGCFLLLEVLARDLELVPGQSKAKETIVNRTPRESPGFSHGEESGNLNLGKILEKYPNSQFSFSRGDKFSEEAPYEAS